ncbi:DUF5047 domain-containing protein [Streptomyces sioyaensis]|uniref:DUF5047 domain-containing protein n=1 Tax=Streptomyces sioyaensis TaxID=67364 RepID=UPI00368EDE6A
MDAYYNGALAVADLPISDGSVSVDRGSKIRRTLSLTVDDLSLLPWDATDPLAVYGQELVVSRGIWFADAPEMVPLGTFIIDEPNADVHTGPITLTGKSRELSIQDDKFLAPTSTRGYGGCVSAITALIRGTLPNAVVVNLTSDGRDPALPVATWDTNADRWDAVAQIATSMNAEIYVDALDRFVIVDIPTVATAAVAWDVADGEGGTLVSAGRQMSRSNVFNRVVVSGENTASGSAPVSGVAYDNDPNSPTRWGGPFGKITKTYSSALFTTNGACAAAAGYMLADALAPNIQASLATIPNPALEAGDCLRVNAAGRKDLFIVQSLSVPLTAEGSFSVTLRGGKEDTTG